MRDHDVAEEKAKDRLHVGHVDTSHHTRDRDKGDTREGGTDHADGDDVPRGFPITQKERIVAGAASSCDPCDEEQEGKITGNNQENGCTVHELFLFCECKCKEKLGNHVY